MLLLHELFSFCKVVGFALNGDLERRNLVVTLRASLKNKCQVILVSFEAFVVGISANAGTLGHLV